MQTEIKNCLIKEIELNVVDGSLKVWVYLTDGTTWYSFGDITVYNGGTDYTGIFLTKLFEVARVDSLNLLKDMPVRAEVSTDQQVALAIGHIIDDNWLTLEKIIGETNEK